MAAPYITTLPNCFPYAVQVPAHSAENIVLMLMRASIRVHNGSSFACTSDAPRGYRRIWLSEASLRTLKEAHIIPDLYPIKQSEDSIT